MSERLPEQPGLPIFPEETVQYEIKYPRNELDDNPDFPKRVIMSVNEIDDLPDPDLRDALWRQFAKDRSDKKSANIVYAYPNGRYSHSFSVPTKRRGIYFTEQGSYPDEHSAVEANREASMTDEQLVYSGKSPLRKIFDRLFG